MIRGFPAHSIENGNVKSTWGVLKLEFGVI